MARSNDELYQEIEERLELLELQSDLFATLCKLGIVKKPYDNWEEVEMAENAWERHDVNWD